MRTVLLLRRGSIISFALTMFCVAKNIGVQGHTYEIKERNLLDVIQERLLLNADQIDNHNRTIAQRARAAFERPPTVSHVRKTLQPRQFLYDPSLFLASDLKDHQGRVFAAKGQRFNPLTQVSWGDPLLLFDGDDPNHQAWARAQSKAKWVLTSGAPLHLTQQEKHPVFFDQGGKIVQKFGIQQIPCRIIQEGLFLKVEEIRLMAQVSSKPNPTREIK